MEQVRMTIAVATVLREFLDGDVTRPRYGYELSQATGYPSGKLYPILARLTRAGWLTKELENIDPAEMGRPPRRLYRLTADARVAAHEQLAELARQMAPPPRRRIGRLQLRPGEVR